VIQPEPDVLISECGPRDGLQMATGIMPTPAKRSWIDALHASGLKEIEVASFVPPSTLPQMADASEVVRHASTLSGLRVLALVPNLKGAEAAIRSGAHVITIPVSASEGHSRANVRKSRAEMVSEVARIVALRDRAASSVKIEANVSVAFGCTIDGAVPEPEVIRLAMELAKAGADQVGLSDTTGMGNPAQVRRLFRSLNNEVGNKAGAAHFHNTRGLGLANCLAALDVGVTSFDSSLAGLGGCPYAPGASGNVVTEDLVFMFEAMGLRTGVSIDGLMAAREVLKRSLPDEALYGMIAEAGLPKGYALELAA
jgi:hydroxymethylglutaryl-CoA lyase